MTPAQDFRHFFEGKVAYCFLLKKSVEANILKDWQSAYVSLEIGAKSKFFRVIYKYNRAKNEYIVELIPNIVELENIFSFFMSHLLWVMS